MTFLWRERETQSIAFCEHLSSHPSRPASEAGRDPVRKLRDGWGHPGVCGGWKTISKDNNKEARTTTKAKTTAGSFDFAQDRLFDWVAHEVLEQLRSA